MLRKFFFVFFLFHLSTTFADITLENNAFDHSTLPQIPVAYKGRFRPMESYARLWLYEFHHDEQLDNSGSAIDLLWKMHFLGHIPWNDKSLFWLSDKTLKKRLILDPSQKFFSFNQLYRAIYENKESNLSFLKPLLTYTFLKQFRESSRSHNEKQELKTLSTGLWLTFQDQNIITIAIPKAPLWQFLQPGMIIFKEGRLLPDNFDRQHAEASLNLLAVLNQFADMQESKFQEENYYADSLDQLVRLGTSPAEIATILEAKYPLHQRLQQADQILKVLPSRQSQGIWIPIRALKLKTYDPNVHALVPIGNFTLYPDPLFESIRTEYLALEKAVLLAEAPVIQKHSQMLAHYLNEGYAAIAGTRYVETTDKGMAYPSSGQLMAEVWYYRYPLTLYTISAYAIAAILILLAIIFQKKIFTISGIACLIAAFIVHTLMLGIRCYILQRPPVSNMFETVIYVPWVAVLASFILFGFLRRPILLFASALTAIALLAILQATSLNSGLENVQAVLDSQYWLLIHVLLVVGSYGAFVLAGVLGHVYLICRLIQKKETLFIQYIGTCILQTMYLGVAMLVPGTILGGVWAAESWGRFWDWDPKESWAFISICIYIIWIHAYRFKYIRNFGMAIGSVAGLLAISFTWYGVNYILGTGLHSYGFGSGGEIYYYSFFIAEILFMLFAWRCNYTTKIMEQ